MFNTKNISAQTINRVKKVRNRESAAIAAFERAERIQELEKRLKIIKNSKKKGSPFIAVGRDFRTNVMRRVNN